MENSKNSSLSKLIPVMLCFFAMGFVDLVEHCLQLCKGRPRSVGLAERISSLHWYSSGS